MRIEYKGEDLEVLIDKYAADESAPAIQLVDEDGFPYATATVYLEDYDYEPGEVTIKNYSENEGILDVLVENGIVSKMKMLIPSGFVWVPVCDLLYDGNN